MCVSSSLCCLFCWLSENVSCATRTSHGPVRSSQRPPGGPWAFRLQHRLCWLLVEVTVVHLVQCKLLPSWRDLLVFMCTNATLILGTLFNECLRVIRVAICDLITIVVAERKTKDSRINGSGSGAGAQPDLSCHACCVTLSHRCGPFLRLIHSGAVHCTLTVSVKGINSSFPVGSHTFEFLLLPIIKAEASNCSVRAGERAGQR